MEASEGLIMKRVCPGDRAQRAEMSRGIIASTDRQIAGNRHVDGRSRSGGCIDRRSDRQTEV